MHHSNNHSNVDVRRELRSDAGMTLIEITVVIGLIAFLYAVAAPQLALRSGTEAANKVQRVADDIRNAYDLAVLNNKTYRLSFVFSTGEYWLEESDRPVNVLGDGHGGKDPTPEEEKAKGDEFDAQTKEYKNTLGDPIKDEEGNPIPGSNDSPIIKNREAARGPKWTKVSSVDWDNRSLGPYFLISSMQAEHHEQKQVLADVGEQGRGLLYFFPDGRVEKAFITIAFKKDKMLVDEDQKPYTIVTRPFLGTADVIGGSTEIDVHDLKEESGQS